MGEGAKRQTTVIGGILLAMGVKAGVYHAPAKRCRLHPMVAMAARAMARAAWLPRLPQRVLPAGLGALLAEEAAGYALWLPVAFGAGIAFYLGLAAEPPSWAGALAVSLCLAALVLLRGDALRLALGLALAASLGFATIQLHAEAAGQVEVLPARAVVIEARIAGLEALPQGRRITLADATWPDHPAPLPRTLRLRLRNGDATLLHPGDTIRVRALLRAPAAPAEPGAFDFQRAAFFAGAAGTGFALGPVEVTGHAEEAPRSGFWTFFARLQADLVLRARAAIAGQPGAVAAALLSGQQAGIAPREAQAMRDSGLSHLLSVSGLHVSIVIGLVFFVLRFLLAAWEWAALRLPIKEIAMVAGLLAGGFYTLVTGADVPMLRSFLMAALVVAALLLGRNPITMRGLALAAFVVLLLRPDAVASASFQMSFAAVAALVAGFQSLRGRLPGWLEHAGPLRRFAAAIVGLVLTSVLAGVATAPYALFHFQRASLYGVAANALAVPLTSFFVMPAGMLAVLLMPFGLDWIALVPMGWGSAAILWIAEVVADWPGAAPFIPAMPFWGLIVCTLGLLLLCLLRTRLALLGVPLLLAGLVSPAFHRAPDVLVSADAGLIAVNAGGVLHLSRAQSSNPFVVETWQRRAGGIAVQPWACADPFCRIGDVALVPRGAAPPGLCGGVAVVVGHEPLRTRCRGSLMIDRFDVWRDGPHAVWLTADGAIVLSDRAVRGDRPWVPPRPRPRGAAPLAPVE